MKIIYARTQFWFDLKSGGSVGHTLGVLGGLKDNGCQIKIVSNEQFFGIHDFDYSIISPVAAFSPTCVTLIFTQSLGLAFGTMIT